MSVQTLDFHCLIMYSNEGGNYEGSNSPLSCSRVSIADKSVLGPSIDYLLFTRLLKNFYVPYEECLLRLMGRDRCKTAAR